MNMKAYNAAAAFAATLAVVVACSVSQPAPTSFRQVLALNSPVYGGCKTSADFISQKVQLLNVSGFDLQRNGASGTNGEYVAPTADMTDSIPPNQTQVLAAAWDIAPTYLQQALCNDVDWVFIDQDNQAPLGWSYWEESKLGQVVNASQTHGPGSGNGVFIAVSQQLLTRAQPATGSSSLLPIGQLEFDVVRRLFTTATPQIIDKTNKIQVTVNDLGTGTTLGRETVLSVLAREMGFVTDHVLTRAAGAGNFPLCTADATQAFTNSFYGFSWNSFNQEPEIGRIHALGEQTQGPTAQRPPKSLALILSTVRGGSASDVSTAVGYVEGVYEGNLYYPLEWADFLASQAPIEDFVETFRLFALYNAEVNQVKNGAAGGDISAVTVNFKGSGAASTTNVLSNLTTSGTPLYAKEQCMQYLVTQLPATPPTN
jgi:hypothetical protein